MPQNGPQHCQMQLWNTKKVDDINYRVTGSLKNSITGSECNDEVDHMTKNPFPSECFFII